MTPLLTMRHEPFMTLQYKFSDWSDNLHLVMFNKDGEACYFTAMYVLRHVYLYCPLETPQRLTNVCTLPASAKYHSYSLYKKSSRGHTGINLYSLTHWDSACLRYYIHQTTSYAAFLYVYSVCSFVLTDSAHAKT